MRFAIYAKMNECLFELKICASCQRNCYFGQKKKTAQYIFAINPLRTPPVTFIINLGKMRRKSQRCIWN